MSNEASPDNSGPVSDPADVITTEQEEVESISEQKSSTEAEKEAETKDSETSPTSNIDSDEGDDNDSYASDEMVDEEEERRKIAEVMRVYEAAELRKKLLIVQQQLHNFHDLTAEMDALKARNQQLKDKVSKLHTDRTKREEKVKKTVGKKVCALEDEIIELKLELAQSRGKEDYHNAEMRSMMDTKNKLENEIETLQLQGVRHGDSHHAAHSILRFAAESPASSGAGPAGDNNANRMQNFFKASNQKPPSRSN
mmetsp:Transcript_4308/g.5902  ORF Transcript_4308/g.5902 Transcript_4308/m.5902 type:complete len:254 (-) Transcript_4308:181-942(-)